MKREIKLGTDGKTRLHMRVYRAKTGKWEELSLLWYVRNFLREIRVQAMNRFRVLLGKAWQYATVLTDGGCEWIVDKLDETLQTTGDYIGWGTGSGTAAKADTALFTEAAEARVTATRSQPSADTLQWVGTMTSSSSQTITNAGNFTASTGGTLIVHGDFTGIPLNNGDKIEFTIKLQIT